MGTELPRGAGANSRMAGRGGKPPASTPAEGARRRSPPGDSGWVDRDWLGNVSRRDGLLFSFLSASTEWALLATDIEGLLTLWSRGSASLYGYEPQAAVSRLTWWDLCVQGPAPPAPLDEALRDGTWTGALTQVRVNGERFPARVVVCPLRDGDGRLIGFLTLSRDVSAELRQLEALDDATFKARSLFDANVVPLVTTDLLGVITDVNRPAEALTGRSRSELVGTQILGYVTDVPRARAALATLLREGRVTGLHIAVRRPDGSEAEVLISGSTVAGEDGRPRELLATVLDLTEQRRLQEELRRSRDYCRDLISAAADGLVTVDADGVIRDATSQACALAECDREELVGAGFAGCFRDADHAQRVLADALAGRPASGTELHLATGEDSVKRVAVNVARLRERADGGRLVVSLRDITREAALRDRLAHERAYNRSVIEASANGLVISDLRGRITDVNGTMSGLSGRPFEDLLGADVAGCFADPGAATEAIHRALLAGGVTNVELSLASPGVASALVNISIMRDDAGGAGGLLLSVRDISEQVKLREELSLLEAYTRAIIESSHVALFVLHEDGLIADVNQSSCELTGYARSRLLGRRFSGLFTDSQAAQQGLRKAFQDGRVVDHQLVLARTGSPGPHVSFNAGMFVDPRDRQRSLIASARDISAQKAVEDQLDLYMRSLLPACSGMAGWRTSSSPSPGPTEGRPSCGTARPPSPAKMAS